MSSEERLAAVKAMLDIEDTSMDDKLARYLSIAKTEILQWLYQGDIPVGAMEVPAEYEAVQIQAVVNSLSHEGSFGQTAHSENGIARKFSFTDMVDYIHKTIIPYAKVR